MDSCPEHERRREALADELSAARNRGSRIALSKGTSNLFRRRDRTNTSRIDVRRFNRVLHVDPSRMAAEVEGMTTYEAFTDATLPHGLLPAVVPQLKTITAGGAVSGVGIESSSFRYGLVHETVEEMEVLLGDGSILACSSTLNPDLFYGIANSYGTLGYILRLRARLVAARPYVHIVHNRFDEPDVFFECISKLCRERRLNFLDGVVFGPQEMYLTSGEFCDETPGTSDYTYKGIYYRSIQRMAEDWLSARDYIWRWDTDWFWCSKQFHAQHPIIRLLAGRRFLNSRTYQRVMRFASRVLPDAGSTEPVIQDVDIPIENAGRFLGFLLREIRITPVWICPFQSLDPNVAFPLYSLDQRKVYVNFGFWDVIPAGPEAGYYNRAVEAEALKLAGKKGLYSRSYYDEDTFWKIYNKPYYDLLKAKYDPAGVFRNLYEKCVESK
jgi:FAD/FMN-containing dehydrogenase